MNQTNKLTAFNSRKLHTSMLGKLEPLEAMAMGRQNWKAALEAAVRIEEQSYVLYTIAQKRVEYPSSKKFLKELAQEELKHKETLWR